MQKIPLDHDGKPFYTLQRNIGHHCTNRVYSTLVAGLVPLEMTIRFSVLGFLQTDCLQDTLNLNEDARERRAYRGR